MFCFFSTSWEDLFTEMEHRLMNSCNIHCLVKLCLDNLIEYYCSSSTWTISTTRAFFWAKDLSGASCKDDSHQGSFKQDWGKDRKSAMIHWRSGMNTFFWGRGVDSGLEAS